MVVLHKGQQMHPRRLKSAQRPRLREKTTMIPMAGRCEQKHTAEPFLYLHYWTNPSAIDIKLTIVSAKFDGKSRVDDKRVLSGIIFINRNGLRSRDAPAEYGLHKTLHSLCKRWCEKGVFAQLLLELAYQGGETEALMIDATHLKTHRTASSLGLKKGGAAA